MRLIDADTLIESMALENAVKWGNKDGYQQDHSYSTLMRYEIKNEIDAQPTIPAVPLDKLCEWLAEHYGSPCQLAEIDCYPQCEPDENGECYGMRADDKRCWHDYLTKWMEGLNGNK